MSGELGTTNLLLGIMAAVSVLEAVAILGMGIAGFAMYRRVAGLVDGIESRHVTPAMARVNGVLDQMRGIIDGMNDVLTDVKAVTATVRSETERVDEAIHHTMDRIDDTAVRVRSNVRARTSHLVGMVRGVRALLEGMLRST